MARVQGTKAEGAATTRRRAAPAVVRKTTDVRELEVADEGKVSFSNSGEKQVDRSDNDIEISRVVGDEKLQQMAFLEEPVTIILAESTEKNPEQYVFCSVNGEGPGPGGMPWLPRNVEITIKRKFVEVLAKARPVHYSNAEGVNPQTGERQVSQRASSSHRYPFQVVHDANPRGRDWLKNLMMRRS